MFRRILVPMDDGGFAESAVLLAAQTAEACGAELHLVRVGPARPGVATTLSRPSWWNEPDALDRLRESLETRSRVETRTRVIEGDPADALLNYARAHEIDLVVMVPGCDAAFLAGLADARIPGLQVPVLLVPSSRCSTPVGRWRILIPLDGSALADRALSPALALGHSLGARYTLLRVLRPVGIPGSHSDGIRVHRGLQAQFETEARQALEETAMGLRRAGLAVETRVESGSEPSKVIAQVAIEEGALIVMATVGRVGPTGGRATTVAESVVLSGLAPLLLLHAGDHPRPPGRPLHPLAR